jgi:transcriptional regulator with XRE-family HTH domain
MAISSRSASAALCVMPRRIDDEHINTQIGLRMRRRRVQLLLSQKALGERVQLSLQAIQKYEAGHSAPPLARLIMIAETLRVPISYFFDGLVSRQTNDAQLDSGLAEKDLRLMSRLQKLSEDIREVVAKLISSALQHLEHGATSR